MTVSRAASSLPLVQRAEEGQAASGHSYRRTPHADGRGETVLERSEALLPDVRLEQIFEPR
jgi:hypothetical protein